MVEPRFFIHFFWGLQKSTVSWFGENWHEILSITRLSLAASVAFVLSPWVSVAGVRSCNMKWLASCHSRIFCHSKRERLVRTRDINCWTKKTWVGQQVDLRELNSYLRINNVWAPREYLKHFGHGWINGWNASTKRWQKAYMSFFARL